MMGFEWLGATDDEYELDDIHVENPSGPDEFAIFDVSDEMANDVWISALGESFVDAEEMR